MNKRERIAAALRGQPVDRVPFGFWKHDFTREGTARELADETIRLFRKFDWDFIKPQSRPYCFSEMWGLTFETSTEQAVWPRVTHFPVTTPDDFAGLEVADPSTGALGEQLEVFRLVREAVGKDVPIVATIFSPVMIAAFLLPNGRQDVARFMRDAPEQFERGLSAISQTLARFARLCTEQGVDGVFFATNAATRAFMTPEQFDRFERPFHLQILAEAKGWFNIIHMCGDGILFDEFLDHPAGVFSWEASGQNPSVVEARERSGRVVLAGLPGKPWFGEMADAAVERMARESIAAMDGRSLILGPGCSVNPDAGENLFFAASRAVHGAALPAGMAAVATSEAPAAIGPYSQAIASNGLLFVSGQLPIDPATGTMADDPVEQCRQALRNVAAIARQGGADLSRTVKTTVLVTDLSKFAAINDAYAEFFEAPYPARATFEVAALPRGASVEIEAIIALPEH